MELNAEQCYQAVLTRDTRFDGRFFVAVKTTGIYCRPVCRVKTPMRKNCSFFAHAAGAEAAGYRPCRRCRPELAPGNSPMDINSHLARSAAQYIHQDFLAEHSLQDLAQRLGITDRQLRRVFREEFGVSPVEFWQTQRLLLAKQLLTDSRMPLTAVALASGFGSLRRFNAVLKQQYRLTPTELRKEHKRRMAGSFGEFSFRLPFRPPLNWDRMLAFFARRAIPHVETVRGGLYLRTAGVRRGGRIIAGHLLIGLDEHPHCLAVRMSESLLPVCAIVLERVRRLFDLHADPAAIEAVLGALVNGSSGLRVPGSFDGFEAAVRAIVGQQVSVAGARTLLGRLVAHCGTAVETPEAGLSLLFPAAERIASASVDEIARLGMPAKRARALITLAQETAAGRLILQPGRPVDETMRQLRRIPGIGEWTAQYISMRALSWPDAFPHTDLGIMKALGERRPTRVLAMAEKWRPWRAYAALHLWNALEKPT